MAIAREFNKGDWTGFVGAECWVTDGGTSVLMMATNWESYDE